MRTVLQCLTIYVNKFNIILLCSVFTVSFPLLTALHNWFVSDLLEKVGLNHYPMVEGIMCFLFDLETLSSISRTFDNFLSVRM